MGALLASGGMGAVWAAHDLLLDRAVAVKVLGGALAGDGRAAERLRREARAAARLEHPGIARVLDLGEHDGRPYLVMELLEGESLAARIDRAGPMPPGEAARVVAAVADALEAAHAAGVVHRDVKPGNVFLTSAGEVKVLDFGIAWCAHDAAHSEVELAMAHVNADPPPLRGVAPSAPPFLIAACHQAMAKDPATRPPSAAAFAQLVRAPGPGSAGTRPLRVASVPGATARLPVPPRGPGPRRPRPRRRGLLVALLLAGVLLAALPALAGELGPLVRERLDGPLAVLEPAGPTPAAEAPQGPVATDATPDPGAQPAGDPGQSAFADPVAENDRLSDSGGDRDRHDDSSGSGRSGGGSGGGGSSGPG
jgi:serine/threonine-protein kinase